MDNQATSSSPVVRETTVMSVWPSIAAGGVGRVLGRLSQLGPELRLGTIPFRPGWLLAVGMLPVSVFLYANKIVPRIPVVLVGMRNPWCQRYRLTTHRVLVEHPFDALSPARREGSLLRGTSLRDFDSIIVETLPGHEWYSAGDLVFRQEGAEVFRLPGVPHPEAFRQTLLKTRTALLSLEGLREQQLAV